MKMARDGCRAWKKFGALDFKECILEDEKPAFFKSRAHRDAVNKKVMAYFAKKYGKDMSKAMPFDLNRFSFGGSK